ncbi:MAG TPA: hypothetical protein VFY99_01085 [Solirubrobacterales bacterium]
MAEAELPGVEAGGGSGDGQPRFPSSPDQRLSALAAAVREHESRARHHAIPARPEDLVLYRRLRQICGGR